MVLWDNLYSKDTADTAIFILGYQFDVKLLQAPIRLIV